jgi:putative transcriptional regulator
MRPVGLLLAAVILGTATTAVAQRPDLEQPMLLVSSPRLVDPRYHQTVVLVVPIGEGKHAGVIVNRPTPVGLAAIFPDHPPSKEVKSPVFEGGPFGSNVLIAAISAAQNPGRAAAEVVKNIYLTGDSKLIDEVIERAPQSARYFVGHIQWVEGELAAELGQGMWRIAPAGEVDLFGRDPKKLWDELWLRVQMLFAALPRRPLV